MNPVRQAIALAILGTAPRSAERLCALSTVRWLLATEDGRFLGVDDRAQVRLVTDASSAAIYDGRDNEELKAQFFAALLREPLTVVLLA